jgi:sigma-E factor negative regulatory protein RseC
MIEERARVIEVQGSDALVAALRSSGCGACGAQRGCGVSTLGKLLRLSPPVWKVENTGAARVGDEVILGIEDDALLGAAALAYVPLLAGLLLGAALGAAAGSGEAMVLLGAVLGLSGGFGSSRALAATASARYAPRMLDRCRPRSATSPLSLDGRATVLEVKRF